MWARAVQPLRSRLHRTVRFARSYNGQYQQNNQQLPTYFQQPPAPPKGQRRILSSLLLGTTCFAAGAYGTYWLFDLALDDLEDQIADGSSFEARAMHEALNVALEQFAAQYVPLFDLERAKELISIRSGYSVTPTAVGHFTQVPSNMPCEDSLDSGIYNLFQDQNRDWANWSIFDGHAGPNMATLLKGQLAVAVGHELWSGRCMDRSYVPNDFTIIRAIKKAFRTLDQDILQRAAEKVTGGEADLALSVAMLAPAVSGSCALLALYDPARNVLRVANTGDSRAVLGRWDEHAAKYTVLPMSEDQTGFHPEEVARLKREHPDEEGVVDPKTGRVLGIAVSRAFGDARWKWSSEMSKTVYEKFWGPTPRPNVKSPPYLTAEPEVMETQIQSGEHPDFLIMASDGLWDNISSEDAVVCVQQWLDRYKPTQFLSQKDETEPEQPGHFPSMAEMQQLTRKPYMPDFTTDPNEDPEVYWDDMEKTMKWKVSPKHFVVEDNNCAIHLARNSLGGSRRNLFRGLITLQPPYSRKVRDDITVQVIFFGVDASEAAKSLHQGA